MLQILRSVRCSRKYCHDGLWPQLRRISRDEYSKHLGRYSTTVSINALNVTGKWEQMEVHADVFNLWRWSAKCILVCVQNANTHKQAVSPYLDTFEKLQAIHHPNNQYMLFCMYTHTPAAFEAMVGITQTPGCPFTIQHRVDYSTYRCAMEARSPIRSASYRFFGVDESSGRKSPVDYIHIDGMFYRKDCFPLVGQKAKPQPGLAPNQVIVNLDFGSRSRKDIARIEAEDTHAKAANFFNEHNSCAGMVLMRGQLDVPAIEYMRNQWDFIKSKEFVEAEPNIELMWYDIFQVKKMYLFVVGQQATPPPLIPSLCEVAQKHGITLYHKKNGQFVYLSP